MRALQGLKGRLAYLANEEVREAAWLMDQHGQELTEAQALVHLGGPESAYQEVVFAPSALECEALQERWPHMDREEVARHFGTILATEYGRGRNVVLAVHFEANGTWHYHAETTDPLVVRDANGAELFDAKGNPKLVQLDGLSGHLDETWVKAWTGSRPAKSRLRGREFDAVKAAQDEVRAERRALRDERREAKKVLDEVAKPIRAELRAARESHAGFDAEREIEIRLAEATARHAEAIRENWRREAELEYRGDLLHLRRMGYSEASLEAKAARDRAEMRLVTRENGALTRRERADRLVLEAGRGDARLKEVPIPERAPIREADYQRELEVIDLRFRGLHREILSDAYADIDDRIMREQEALLGQEEAARTAAKLRHQAACLRDEQEALQDRFSQREQRDEIAAARESAIALAHLEMDPSDDAQREALAKKIAAIEAAYRGQENALKAETFEERETLYLEARKALPLRHEMEREASELDAKSRNRDRSQAQIDRLESRLTKDAAWLEVAWLNERISKARMDEYRAFEAVVQKGELDDLREAKREVEAEIERRAELLSEEERATYIRQQIQRLRVEATDLDRELFASRPPSEILVAAVEERVALEREADRLRAVGRGIEWDEEAFEAGVKRDLILRAEARNTMRHLRLEEARLLDLVMDREWKEIRENPATIEAEKVALEARVEAAKADARERVVAGNAAIIAVIPDREQKVQEEAERSAERAQRRVEIQNSEFLRERELERWNQVQAVRYESLTLALEVQADRHAKDLEIRRSEAKRKGGELTPDQVQEIQDRHDLERRRLAAKWNDLEATRLGHSYEKAMASAASKVALSQVDENVERQQLALRAKAGTQLGAVTTKGDECDFEIGLIVRELALAERRNQVQAERQVAAIRKAGAPHFEEAARLLGERQAAELRAATERAQEPDHERIQKIRERHSREEWRFVDTQLHHEAAIVRDQAKEALARGTGRDKGLELEAQALAELRAGGFKERSKASEAARRREWEFLRSTETERHAAYTEGMQGLAMAQALEVAAFEAKGEAPKKGLKDREEKAEALMGRHAIQRTQAECDQLRTQERAARGTLEFGKFLERTKAYRQASTAMTRRHSLEAQSLEIRMDLKGVSENSTERQAARATLAERQGKERDGLQKAISRVQRGPRKSLRTPGKGLVLGALRDGLSKLKEEADKAGVKRGSNAADKAHGGLGAAVVTVAQTAAKATLGVAEKAAQQAALQAQHAMRLAVHAARSAAVAVVNPIAGLKAMGSGAAEVGKESARDLGKGSLAAAKGLARDTAGGAKTASKQAAGGVLGLVGPGSGEAKAVAGMAREAIMAAKRLAQEAVNAVRSAMTGNVLGVAKAGVGAGLAVGQGGLGLAKEGGAALAKKLPVPVDKALGLLGKVPVLGVGAQALKLGGEVAHGATHGVEFER